MSEPDKIEHRCRCGWCEYRTGHCMWVFVDFEQAAGDYCEHCGYHLAADGFAYRMVRADEVANRVADQSVKSYIEGFRECRRADRPGFYVPSFAAEGSEDDE